MTAHATHTTAPPTTSRATAARFLAAIAGDPDARELLELRYRLDDGQRMGQVFDAPRRLRALAARAVALGGRTDVYVGCAPRTRRHGGRDAVRRALVLWADCDGDDAVQALERFEPQPSIVVASGTGSNSTSTPSAVASASAGNSSESDPRPPAQHRCHSRWRSRESHEQASGEAMGPLR
jgi:hypothetical protein